MLTRWHSVAGYILILLCLVGCAGGGSDRSPVEPSTSDDLGITALREESSSGRGRMLLGFWDVALNTDTGEFEAVALRQAAFHTNIVTYIQDPAYLGISVLYENYTTGEFHLDVTLSHPFPDSNLRGFDVRGIVFGNMSARDDPDLLAARDDPDLLWLGPNGFRLLNFDGWTRWWNPEEFTTSGLFGYTEGAFGTENFLAPATLNPYKYFANVLSATDPVVPLVDESNRGTFATDEGPVTRRYELRFPIVGGFPDAKFQYAVDASWAPPTGGGSTPGIEYFPPEANCPEAFHILVDASDSTAFYNDDEDVGGGDLTLYVEVFDWGTPYNSSGVDGEIEAITVQSATLFDDVVDVQVLAGPGSSNLSGIYGVTVPNVHPTALENQELLVTVISSGSRSYKPPMTGPDYPVGKPLSAYALVTVPIKTIDPIIVGQINTSGDPVDVETRGNLCYALDSVDGLLIVNVAAPEAPIELSTVALPFAPIALDVENGYAYVIDTSGNLQVIDVEPVGGAGIVHTLGLLGPLTSIDADGLYAYVGYTSGILNIIDISDPGSASSVNTVSTTGSINDVKAKDGYAYVAADDMEIFDVDPPLLAHSVGVVDTSSAARAVDVSDSGYAFVGDSSDQLLVVDVDPPGAAAIVETLGLTNPVNDIVCSGDLTYPTVSGEGLKVVYFDASSSTAYLIGELDLTIEPESLSVEGNMAYIDGEVTIVELWEEVPPEGWARTWGGAGTVGDCGYGVAVGGSGNVYVTGYFSGAVDFDPGPDTEIHNAMGAVDPFLSKFDSSGIFLWARTWGGTEKNVANGVAVDEWQNVYVAGRYRGTVDFDPGAGIDNHTSNGSGDAFLSKFDSSGTFQWARTWGGTGYDVGSGVAVDNSGNVCVTGGFQGTVDFDPGAATDDHTSNGGTYDAYLSKFDSSGTFQWARTWGGISWDDGIGVSADSFGNVYVTGKFEDTVDFDPGGGIDNRTSNGIDDTFLSKFGSSGAFQWARTWGGTWQDQGSGVAIGSSGDVLVTGYFAGTVDFNPGAGIDYHTSNGIDDTFLSKFDSSGTFQWARTWGGTGYDVGSGVAVDGSGNICVAGCIFGTVDCDPGPGTDYHSSNGVYDILLSRFDQSGNFHWARTWGGTSGDRGYGVAIDGSGIAYLTGEFRDIVDFAPGDPPCNEAPDIHSSNGYGDAFISKYLPHGCW